MASSSSSYQQNQGLNAFSGIEPEGKRRKVCESSRLVDVFINHRGPDVKHTLATQLYNSLKEVGIRAFLDSEEKELGVSFPSTIETAIRSASVHIAIFSKKYAESAWCLAELVLMLQSKAKIIPVFYEVKPWELRFIEKGEYAKAFTRYAQEKRYLEKLQEWKEALQSLSFVAGEELNSSSDCKNIVAAVQKEVQNKICLHVATYPVGLNNLVKDFERRCLDELVQDFENQCGLEEGKHKASVVGIFGMGGAGKTTLVKELFNRKRSNYSRASFLFDVREASVKSQLPSLQGKLLKDLFQAHNLSFISTEEGKSYIQDHVRRSPPLSFLIVVDDIDHVEQLNALMIMDILNKFGNTLVIVTTRDVGVLITAGITVGYNLKGMDRNDGRELFCWHAFRQPHPSSEYEALVEAFVDVCGGLPLSLQVLGRHVHGRPLSYWRSELVEARKTLPRDVKQRLRISFDALGGEEKQIFMDIACFFIGKPESIAERVWEGSGWNAQHALETLKDKCLLEKTDSDFLSLNRSEVHVLRMHDHLRDLGREMALELRPPDRLWRPKDLEYLESMGFKNILAKTHVRCFHSIFDESMRSGVTFFLGQPDICVETSASLLWLELKGNSTEQPSIPSWICLQNVQCLKIRCGRLKTLWGNRIQAPPQLKQLHIFETFLEEIPDLSGISNNLENVVLDARGWPIQGLSLLESLNMNLCSLSLRSSTLKGVQASTKNGERTTCESLVIRNFKFSREVAWNNGGMSSSVKAPMDGLENLEISSEELICKILISGIHYPSLESIKLHCMENLMEVDLIRIKTLNSLDIANCKLLKSVSGISSLEKLVLLNISQCPELEELSLGRLSCLESIRIVDCEHLKSVSGIPDLRNPVELKVDFTELVASDYWNDVSGVSGFRKLAQLNISACPELEELRLGHLSCLEKITIENCNHLKSVSGINNLAKLVELEISDCGKLEFEYLCLSGMKCLERITFGRNVTVKYFELDGCQYLKTIEYECGKLVELSIRDCPELQKLPEVIYSICLERIIIDGCGKLGYLPLANCQNLKSVSGNMEISWLYITNCPELEDLQSVSRVSCFELIQIYSCAKLQNIMLPTTLICLSVDSCSGLQRIGGTGDLTKLTDLIINKCPELEELPSFSRASCLEEIGIYSCEKLQNIMLPTTLISLSLHRCRDLQRIVGTGDLTKLTELEIFMCPELEELPSVSRASCLEKIGIYSCEKLQSIMLPTTLISLCVERCRDLQRIVGTGDLTKLTELDIVMCHELEELSSVSRASCLEKIHISSCEKLQNIMLPTTLINLYIHRCRGLQRIVGTGDLTKLTELDINECPELEDLPSVSRASCLEQIRIYSCERLQNIMLPTTLINLSVHRCRGLQSIVGTGDLTKLTELDIDICPELEELPSVSRASCLEQIRIYSCKRLQNIMLPTTLINLSVDRCRGLQRIVGTGDLTKLTELEIDMCPELEELPSFSRVSCLKHIVIDSSEKLENIAGIQELHISEFMKLRYCSNAVIRNCIQKLKSVPWLCLVNGKAVDGAESTLNEYLFSDAHIGAEAVTDNTKFGAETGEVLSAVIFCFVVVVHSSTSVEDINRSLPPDSDLDLDLDPDSDGLNTESDLDPDSDGLPPDSVFYINRDPDSDFYFNRDPDSDLDLEFEPLIDLNRELQRDLDLCQGEWIITIVAHPRTYPYIKRIEDVLRRYGIMKKGFRVNVREGEEWKIVQVLGTIVDRLHHYE